LTSQRTWRAQATFSPDRRLVALAAPASHAGVDLVLRDAEGGPERRISHHVEQFFWLSSDRLLVTRPGRLTEVDTSGRELDTLPIPDSLANVPVLDYQVGTIAFDRGSRRLAWWSTAARAIVGIDWARKQWSVIARSAAPLTMLAWARNGSLIVADLDARAERPMFIYRVSLPDSRLRPVAERPRDCYFMAADPAGRRVACSVLPAEMNVWLAEPAH
jgi:hypothetical protein